MSTDTQHSDQQRTSSPLRGLEGVPLSLEPLARKEFVTDQEVRWCPGCGDYAILAAFQSLMPQLGIKRENTVIISGIGCSARFPYYLNSYGMHSIHGRATAIATGLAVTRPDLGVWVVTGDGDALSIGGNHLIHALRRNVNLTIMVFNNRIYGLTKGQYSPTSEQGKITKSTPMGSLDQPFNPVSLALGAEASFVARTIDSDRAHLTAVLKAAANHRGSKFIEIYQNCPIFNDGAFDELKGPGSEKAVIPLIEGEPITFGADGSLCVVRDPLNGGVRVAETAGVDPSDIVVHDPHLPDASQAFALSRLTDSGVLHQSPIGIFRDVERPAYDDLVREQMRVAEAGRRPGAGLQQMVTGQDIWQIG